MGYDSYNSVSYSASVRSTHDSGKSFLRARTAASTGDYSAKSLAEILNPRLLKAGMRESCFAPGENTLLPVLFSIDGTGSMSSVPKYLQENLPTFLDLVVGQGIAEHPNVAFIMHDDHYARRPDGCFQMSQFELGAEALVTALNEMIIPGQGGGNSSEDYHLAFYAAARHTRLENNERDPNDKGFFFMICDEDPYFNEKWETEGTSRALAKEVFGDTLEEDVPMLQSVKETLAKYHVFVLRPHDTSHGSDERVTTKWQRLLQAAGGNAQNVIEIESQKEILPTAALCVGRLFGEDLDDLVDVLKSTGVSVSSRTSLAVNSVVPYTSRTSVTKMPDDVRTGSKTARVR